MYIGFSKKLKSLGGMHVHVGKRVRGKWGWILLFCVAMVNLYWYMIVGCIWLMYGVGLLFYLPIKAIVKAIKKRQIAKKNAVQS